MSPRTGSLACTSNHFVHQYTKYHGTICYANNGVDDVSSSGFWSYSVTGGNNYGRVYACSTIGDCEWWYFDGGRNVSIDFSGLPSKIASVRIVEIDGQD